MDDDKFQEKLGPLRRAISEVLCLAFPSLARQAANRMTEHLRGLNLTTFKRRLREAANEFRVELDQADVEAITATCNELVHRAGFVTDKPLNEFQRVQSVLDKLLLGVLGYRGPSTPPHSSERYPGMWCAILSEAPRPALNGVASRRPTTFRGMSAPAAFYTGIVEPDGATDCRRQAGLSRRK